MTFTKLYFSPTKRRGLSSIVGALLFVVLMVSAFAVLNVALTSQSDIASTGRDVASNDLKKLQEDFTIKVYTDPPVSGQAELFIDVNNLGQNPVEISTVVIAEITDIANDYPSTVYDISADMSFIAPRDEDGILSSNQILLDIAAPSEVEFYTIKVISTLGTIKTYTLVCDEFGCGDTGTPAGAGSLSESLFLDGPNGVNTKTSTVIMFVTNTSEETVTDVQPFRGFAGNADCNTNTFWMFNTTGVNPDNDIVENITNCTVTPNTPVDLGPHEFAIFKWDFTVGGDIGAEVKFCNYVTGDDPLSPPAINSLPQSCDELTIIDPNDCAGCGPGGDGGESIIVLDDLLIRPSIFLTLPSPFGSTGGAGGDKDNLGIVGVQVANPTNATFTVSKVTITGFAPGANNNVLIFDNGGDTENISPNCCIPLIGKWNVSDENVMVWRDFATPIVLTPYSSNSFLLKIKPESNGGRLLESVIVQASVFSSIGSFGKAGYQTTSYSPAGNDWSPIANVFLATTANSVATTHITGHKSNITNGTSTKFIVTLADMDDESPTYIKTGAKMTVNIPRDWEFVSINQGESSSKFIFNATQPQVVYHGDGSTQIIAITNQNLGDQASEEPASIVFNAKSPNKTNDRMYIMYLLADGLTEDNHAVGPQQEAILHVLGNVTGY